MPQILTIAEREADTPLSPLQTEAVQHYAGLDDHAALLTAGEVSRLDDALLSFVLAELSPESGCHSRFEAVRRLGAAITRLETLRADLYEGRASLQAGVA